MEGYREVLDWNQILFRHIMTVEPPSGGHFERIRKEVLSNVVNPPYFHTIPTDTPYLELRAY